ncbi:MAG TPA: condensation domain-containing protein, partial [Clostridia bacterium]|nr:condensation domain-containing protein [Clostridia bacterium]
MGILTDEFLKLYSKKELPEIRLQYRDFSEWQNSGLGSQAIKKQEKYWLDVFKDEIPVLNIPTDYPRPTIQKYGGDRIHFDINRDLAKKVKGLAAEAGATLYMVLLAAFNVLLYKYSGQEDIIVGSPIAGRQHADLENVIGMFVNTLALRNFPKGEKTFAQFLSEVDETSMMAFENQGYQFEELVGKLNVNRDMSRNPVFDVMFILQNMRTTDPTNEEIVFKPFTFKNYTSKFDMTLETYETDDSLTFTLEYSTELFKRETMERLSCHFINILSLIAANKDIKLSEIDMLSDGENRQILVDFNNTEAEYPKDKTIHQLFEEQAKKTPDNIALVSGEVLLSYRELDKKANRVARYLITECAVKPDTLVGIIMERSSDLLVSILGVLKSGAAYVPIDPSYPQERMKNIIDDAEIHTVISDNKHIDLMDRLQWECKTLGTCLCMDSEEAFAEEEAESKVTENKKMWEYIGNSAEDEIGSGGWVNSYTGDKFSQKEMDEFADNTFKKIEPYINKESRVLEIGCASGISMFRIAPCVELYYGTDLSEAMVENNRVRAKL